MVWVILLIGLLLGSLAVAAVVVVLLARRKPSSDEEIEEGSPRAGSLSGPGRGSALRDDAAGSPPRDIAVPRAPVAPREPLAREPSDAEAPSHAAPSHAAPVHAAPSPAAVPPPPVFVPPAGVGPAPHAREVPSEEHAVVPTPVGLEDATAMPEPSFAPRPVTADAAAPAEASPAPESIPSTPPVPAGPTIVPDAAPAVAAFEPLQKARIGGVDLVMRASAVSFASGRALAFTTEGLTAKGNPELVLYVSPPSAVEGDAVRAGLQVLGRLSLLLLERPAGRRLHAGELLILPGEGNAILDAAFAGFVAASPAEPQPVPLPDDRLALLGVTRDELARLREEGSAAFLASRPGPAHLTAWTARG